MLERVEALARTRVDFGFETTLAGRGYTSLLRRLKASGYRIHVFFLWLPSVEMALARVRERVLAGGHSIPEEVVRRRFSRGLKNLFNLYAPLLDTWLVFENAEQFPDLVVFCLGEDRIILNREVFVKIEREAMK